MTPCLHESTEAAAGGAPSVESNRSAIPPFLTKTYNLVDDGSTDDIVSWSEDGTTFVVWRPPEFAKDVLPKYFKHNNFSSFVRQLNTYGFRKIVSERWEFANEFFCKGNQQLLGEIHRRKPGQASLQPAGSAEERISSPMTAFSLSSPQETKSQVETCSKAHDETEKLRRQNLMLLSELEKARRMHSELVLFIQKYLRHPVKDSRCLKTLKCDNNGSVTLIVENSTESRESGKYAPLERNINEGKESVCDFSPIESKKQIDIQRQARTDTSTCITKQSSELKDMVYDTTLIEHASVGLFFVKPSSWLPSCANEMPEPEVSTLSSLSGRLRKLTKISNESVVQEDHGDNPLRLFGFPLHGKKRSFTEVENYSSDDSNDRSNIKAELQSRIPSLKKEKSNESC